MTNKKSIQCSSSANKLERRARSSGKNQPRNSLKEELGNIATASGAARETAVKYKGDDNVNPGEQRLRSFMDASPIGISWMNIKTGKIEYINSKFSQLFGYALEDISTIDQWFERATSGQEANDNFLSRQNFNAGQEINTPVEITVTCKNGTQRIAEIMACRTGEHLVTTFNDITEHKKTYEELRLRAELLDNAYDSIVIFDDNKNYVYVNETALKYHGYSREEFVQIRSVKLIVPGYKSDMPMVSESLNKTGEALFETAHFTKDGSIIHLEVHAKKIRVGDREYVLSISRNINERKEAEKDLRLRAELLDNATDAIFVTDTRGIIQYANKTTIKDFGYSEKEIIGMSVDKLSTENHRRNKEIKEIANKSREYSFEIVYRRKDNSTFPAEVFAKLVEIGGITFVLSISRDITQRRQAEEELQFRAQILNTAMDCIFVWDSNRDCVYINDAVCMKSGFSRKELIGKNLKDVLPPEQYNHVVNTADPELHKQGKSIFEAFEISKTNETIPVEVHSRIIKIGDREYHAGVSRDISERKQVEKELRFRAELLDSTNDSIFVWDYKDDIFVYVNERACTTHGYTREEFAQIKMENIVAPESPVRSVDPKRGIISPSGEDTIESIYKRKDGSVFPIEIHAREIEIEGKRYILSIGRDISRRKAYENDLKLRAELLDNSSDSVYVLDLNGNFIYFNERMLQTYGYTREELSKLTIMNLTNEPSPMKRRDLILKKGEDFFESTHRRKDGSNFPCEIRSKLIAVENQKYILSISRDITQRKQAEEERKENEKKLLTSMEATILALSKTVEMRDPYTSGHQLRATLLANAIATELGFTEEQNRGLYLAGIVHDIGKIIIPAEILSKPGKLSEFEFDLIKMHPRAGYDMLKDIKFPWPIAQIVAQHHERLNGSGYPLNLRDKDILIEAKILAVADVVEAVASHRPYRPAMGIEMALQEIEKNRGILYDSATVDACLNLFRNKNFHFE